TLASVLHSSPARACSARQPPRAGGAPPRARGLGPQGGGLHRGDRRRARRPAADHPARRRRGGRRPRTAHRGRAVRPRRSGDRERGHGRRGGGAPGLTPPRYSRTVEVPVLRPGPVPSAGGKGAVAGMRVVGMKDVARHAGVSVGTVSNVLNRPDIVSPDRRERVEAAIAELGYVRNDAARQLKLGRSSTVGAIVLDSGNPFYAQLVGGIEAAAEDSQLMVIAGSTGNREQRERLY